MGAFQLGDKVKIGGLSKDDKESVRSSETAALITRWRGRVGTIKDFYNDGLLPTIAI